MGTLSVRVAAGEATRFMAPVRCTMGGPIWASRMGLRTLRVFSPATEAAGSPRAVRRWALEDAPPA